MANPTVHQEPKADSYSSTQRNTASRTSSFMWMTDTSGADFNRPAFKRMMYEVEMRQGRNRDRERPIPSRPRLSANGNADGNHLSAVRCSVYRRQRWCGQRKRRQRFLRHQKLLQRFLCQRYKPKDQSGTASQG